MPSGFHSSKTYTHMIAYQNAQHVICKGQLATPFAYEINNAKHYHGKQANSQY